MKPLSDELNELFVRAKKTEDVIEAAVARDREWLRARLDTLKSAIDNQAARAGEQMVSARADAKTKWGVLRASAGQPVRGRARQRLNRQGRA